MAKQLLWGGGRIIWAEVVGKPLHIEPGTTTGTFVPTLQCSGGTQPSMVLTVEGASGTISWCGETWNLPGDSGLQKEVCPSLYQFVSTGGLYISNWEKRITAKDGLRLSAQFYSAFGTQEFRKVFWADQGAGGLSFGPYTGSPPTFTVDIFSNTGGFTFSTFGLGLLSAPVQRPTKYNFAINNAQFGSYTYNSITYTWARGTNW